MPQGCLRFVIVVFPDHTHLLFWIHISQIEHLCDRQSLHKILSNSVRWLNPMLVSYGMELLLSGITLFLYISL